MVAPPFVPAAGGVKYKEWVEVKVRLQLNMPTAACSCLLILSPCRGGPTQTAANCLTVLLCGVVLQHILAPDTTEAATHALERKPPGQCRKYHVKRFSTILIACERCPDIGSRLLVRGSSVS